ncbi:MAG: ATP-binding protein [Acidobacteria bacterium]|nr:ATP-binding protein [Acidobacteriota bacterium]MCL5286977.1 ATP-binding protein [Acidobacteriota bacterium]
MTSKPMPSCEFNSRELLLRLDILVAAEIDAIGPLVERVMEIARDMKCSEGKEFEIEMALREALANAIVHGAKHDPSKHVQLCVGCDESRGMLIIVRDPGEGFDPQSVPSPVMGQNVFSEHGRGIYLINQLMDEVRFERGGTEIHMKKS